MANVTSEFVWKWKRLQQRNGQRDIDRDRGKEREEKTVLNNYREANVN